MAEKVIVKQTTNKVIVGSPGPQGVRGRTILNGNGQPANNLGLEGDFYYDKSSTYFYGPKLSDGTWENATSYALLQTSAEFSQQHSWELAQVIYNPITNMHEVEIIHNLGFCPNLTVKDSSGDILETGIDYNSLNKLTLTMAQPFSGTAYLS